LNQRWQNTAVSLSLDVVSYEKSSAFSECDYSKTEDHNRTDIVSTKPHNSVNLIVSICSICKSIKWMLLESGTINTCHVRGIAHYR